MADSAEKHPVDPGRVMRIALTVLIVLILTAAAYHALRRIGARFARDFTSPFLKTVSVAENTAAGSARMLEPKWKLAGQLSLLERKMMILEAENRSAKHLAAENAALRNLLRMPPKAGFLPVAADIIGRTPALWRERFVLNKGLSAGIREGDAVAAPTESGRLAIAGRVVEVSEETAVVSTIFSADCRFSVAVDPDRAAGAMEFSRDEDTPVIRFLALNGDYRVGALVSTSGIAESTPPGIQVGTVRARREGGPALIRDSLYAELNVEPFVRIDSVHTVVVFTRREGRSR